MMVRPSKRHRLRVTPDTVVWGYLCPQVPPVLHIAPGDEVDIDTVSAMGLQAQNPAAFFAEHELSLVDAARDLVAVLPGLDKGPGPHVLTGPVYIEGAMPGDVLEVRVLDVTPRAPHYGVSFSRPGAGSLPDLLDAPFTQVLPFDMARGVARFSEQIDIPLAPFMGLMGVAPPQRVSSIPPGRFGGNLDLRWLMSGARLYLPVQVPGALFYTGDGHAAQGDGEVNLTGLETSMRVRLAFELHAQCAQEWPLAETQSYYIVLGLDEDLDQAARLAVLQAVRLIRAFTGMSAAQAYSFASLAVDFSLTQIVDGVKGVHGLIPKAQLQRAGPAWWGPRWPTAD